MSIHRSVFVLASFAMAALVATSVVAQNKSLIQIYDLGPSDSTCIIRVLETMIPDNDALAYSTEDAANKLIVSATRDEHLSIRKALYHFSHPVKAALTEMPENVLKHRNNNVFLSYEVPKEAKIDSPKEIAETLLKPIESARLDVDPKTGHILVLAPWSAQVELANRLFGSQR